MDILKIVTHIVLPCAKRNIESKLKLPTGKTKSHLFSRLGKGGRHLGAGVLPPELVGLGEGEELGGGHEVVAHVLPEVVSGR